jgi:hypothetical protein
MVYEMKEGYIMKKLFILLILISMTFLSITKTTYAVGEIEGPDVIYKASNSVLTMTTIKDLYSSIHGDIEVLTDGYTGFGDVPGIYQITFGVVSTAYQKVVDVSVRSTIGNVIAVTSIGETYTIHMHKNLTLTANEIVDVLVNVQMIEYTSTTEITILTNTYADNPDAPGLYTFEFHIADTSGNESTHLTYIKVNNTDKLLPDIVYEDPTSLTWIKDVLYILGTSVGIIVSIIFITKFAKNSKRAKRKRGLI